MGESSAKRMRGGEMDDVIFGGTDSRPARNIAEVMLHLDNADHAAPAPFNETDEIEINRRIERGGGSTYRINGKEVRARDVQLLFADLATGAHSTAMVSQGRVGALIGAKPVERRVLLEEAAGIRGLHSRRHEAELRLTAAEGNLERLEDVIGALEIQYQGLQRQVRQATRYRRLAGNIRRHDGMLMHLKWLATSAAQENAKSEYDQSVTVVAERTVAASSALTVQASTAAKLPALRRVETDAAAKLQRLVLIAAELDRETERMAQAQNESERQVQQISTDLGRERILENDATAALERLEFELGQTSSAGNLEKKPHQVAQAACDSTIEALKIKDKELTTLNKHIVEVSAQRTLLEQRLNDFSQRRERLDARCSDFLQQRKDLTTDGSKVIGLDQAEIEAHTAEVTLTKARKNFELTENEHAQELTKEAKSRSQLNEAEAAVARLEAEAKALTELTEPTEGDLFAPLIDSIKVKPGYEIALGAVLGDDLHAPLDTAAPVHWATLPPLESMQLLPANVEPLSNFVDAPTTLTRRLKQIGVVTATETGEFLRNTLRPGQRLVSLDGALWRWDGYTVASGATTAAATRLAQKNRLNEVRRQLETVKFEAANRLSEFQAARTSNCAVAIREKQARESVVQSFATLDLARETYNRLTSLATAENARLANVDEVLNQARSEIAELEKEIKETTAAVFALEDMSGADDQSTMLHSEIQTLRVTEAQQQGELSRIVHEAETRVLRIASNEAEALQWVERAKWAHQHISELESRLVIAEMDSKRLAERPDEIKEQRNLLFEQTNACEQKRNYAADELVEAESLLTTADGAARRADLQLAESREAQVRAEAQFEQAMREWDAVVAAISETLGCEPGKILDKVGADSGSIPDAEDIELRLARLKRERDNIGPVNLLAESEAKALEEQVQFMRSERDELLAAISRLRQGIAALNREGRERLRAAFTSVNKHFQKLFVRLFGGGRAYLTLTDNDDPLEAGLEIMASPPGKKLQILSLLSGGEQALTALSLLFAVFLTNPAPICVLDEIDAPLDDANVDRVCSLLAEIAAPGRVRFLIVTHHRMTMSRVDRLFGVTMGERGVSQLVSVDLSGAEAIRQSA